jgi:hypothetical protein
MMPTAPITKTAATIARNLHDCDLDAAGFFEAADLEGAACGMAGGAAGVASETTTAGFTTFATADATDSIDAVETAGTGADCIRPVADCVDACEGGTSVGAASIGAGVGPCCSGGGCTGITDRGIGGAMGRATAGWCAGAAVGAAMSCDASAQCWQTPSHPSISPPQ